VPYRRIFRLHGLCGSAARDRRGCVRGCVRPRHAAGSSGSCPAWEAARNADDWHPRMPAAMLSPWKFPRIGEISRACVFKFGHVKTPRPPVSGHAGLSPRARAYASAGRPAVLFLLLSVRAFQPGLACFTVMVFTAPAVHVVARSVPVAWS